MSSEENFTSGLKEPHTCPVSNMERGAVRQPLLFPEPDRDG
jgi:hypothetical protein